ncbi:MAG TPA: hypothetical protein VF266_02075 [Thermoanaerobaculia bacterium]
MSQAFAEIPTLPVTNHLQIPFAKLDGQTQLPDGDKIAVQVTVNACSDEYIRIGLQLAPGITWWKGIQLDEIVVVQCQDSQNYAVSQVGYEVFKNRHLNLWKAKFLGAHTPMYTVSDAATAMKPGGQYLFKWLKD